jgi:hypothetical protein
MFIEPEVLKGFVQIGAKVSVEISVTVFGMEDRSCR